MGKPDGVLYDKNQNALMAYPVAKSGEYEIPQGIEKIGAFAFQYCGSGVPCEFSLKKLPTTKKAMRVKPLRYLQKFF